MKSLTKKLFISIFTLVLVVSILGTTTYAWFTLTKVNMVGTIEMTVSSDTGLELSVDGKTFKRELTSSEINEKIGDLLKYADVTSPNGTTFTFADGTTAIKNKDYVEFELWFKATGVEAGTVIYLSDYNNEATYLTADDSDGTFVVSQGIAFKTDVDFWNGAMAEGARVNETTGTTIDCKASDAMRISVQEVIVPNNVIPGTVGYVEATALTAGTLSGVKMFDLSGNHTERGFGAEQGALSYKAVKDNAVVATAPTNPNAITILNSVSESRTVSAVGNPYRCVTAGTYNIGDTITKTVYDALVEAEKANFEINSAAFTASVVSGLVIQNVVTENPCSVGKIKVRIWLEGWDADCFNSIYKDNVKVQLVFKLGKDYIA